MRSAILFGIPLVLIALVGCNGDDDSGSDSDTDIDTDLPDVTDTTAPTVAITDNVAGVANGDITFTFTFSEDIGDSFVEGDVTVDGGDVGAFSMSGTTATLVVSPPADAAGTVSVSVAADAFEDIAGNANTAAADASQEYDTTVPVIETVLMDFEDGESVGFTGFGGCEGQIVEDPTDASNKVTQLTKNNTAATWAGTTFHYCDNDGIAVLPITADQTVMTVRVWSPDAGTPVRLKVETALDDKKSVETQTLTTVAGGWETLTFDFKNQATGTAELNPAFTFDKLSIFPNFDVDGATAGEKVYYVDDITFAGVEFSTDCPEILEPEEWPLTFDDASTVYELAGFGGAEDATIVADPEGVNGNVARIVKAAGAETWAGTSIATGANVSVEVIPLTSSKTQMTALVWTDKPSIPVLLKIEDAGDPTKSVETLATTTKTSSWEMLTFDFANERTGTAAWNAAYTYNKMSIFFDFDKSGADGGGGTYYCDQFDIVE